MIYYSPAYYIEIAIKKKKSQTIATDTGVVRANRLKVRVRSGIKPKMKDAGKPMEGKGKEAACTFLA